MIQQFLLVIICGRGPGMAKFGQRCRVARTMLSGSLFFNFSVCLGVTPGLFFPFQIFFLEPVVFFVVVFCLLFCRFVHRPTESRQIVPFKKQVAESCVCRGRRKLRNSNNFKSSRSLHWQSVVVVAQRTLPNGCRAGV